MHLRIRDVWAGGLGLLTTRGAHRSKREDRLRSAGGFFAAAMLFLFAGGPAISQQPAASTPAAKQSAPQPPTAQPSLDVDRDPAPSPDPDPPPQAVSDQQPNIPLGTISRGTGGRYTLREDAYEVRLNASVFDSSGHSVQTLDKDAFHVYEDGVPQTIASCRCRSAF
jgi:Ca-activated chloride channel family protein